MVAEEDYVTLSALQHYAFCPRQCAIIHIEREWTENVLTTFGKIEHERVDSAVETYRGGVRTVRSVSLVNHALGIKGVADVVEFHTSEQGISIIPVEYKHGQPKEHRADAIQLCAQALCLEEMHSCCINIGYLYYRSVRRRMAVEFGVDLRNLTLQTIIETRRLLKSGELLFVSCHAGCKACSLYEICLPPAVERDIAAYNNRRFAEVLQEL